MTFRNIYPFIVGVVAFGLLVLAAFNFAKPFPYTEATTKLNFTVEIMAMLVTWVVPGLAGLMMSFFYLSNKWDYFMGIICHIAVGLWLILYSVQYWFGNTTGYRGELKLNIILDITAGVLFIICALSMLVVSQKPKLMPKRQILPEL